MAALDGLVAREGGAAARKRGPRQLCHGVVPAQDVLDGLAADGLWGGLKDATGLGIDLLDAALAVHHDDPVKDCIKHPLKIDQQRNSPHGESVPKA